ncbi:MAG: hypothetical protein MUP22_00435, partial [Desulfobacterales bacterium]|nr:hypothetical protein [Desulfobacterales bacterium]
DNNSNEPGLKEYIENCNWLDHRIFKVQSHPEAMNQLVEIAQGEYILIWPEDVQFVIKGSWMRDLIEIMSKNEFIGSMCLDYMRKVTIQNTFHPKIKRNKDRFVDEILRYGIHFRRSKLLISKSGFKVRTFGWVKPGICGSGIPSLTPTRVWRMLGPWKMTDPQQKRLIDSSRGAEGNMLKRVYELKMPMQGAIPLLPVAADIITDPTGCKAKVRGRYRYGVYMPPPNGKYYYKIRGQEDIELNHQNLPLSFADGVIPIGFDVPVDSRGDRLKSSINMSVKYDIEENRYIPLPLHGQRDP